MVSGTGSTDNASFTITGNSLKLAIVPDFETKTSYSVLVRSTDASGLSFEKQFAISITNVNEAPTNIALSNSSLAENNAVGTAIGTLSTTDVDAGDTFTYTLVSGTGSTDNASFTIAGNSLKLAIVPDFETKTSYSVLVRSTDAAGLSFEKQFTIAITNVNEVPTDIALSNASIAENSASGTAIGTLSTTDVDAGDTFTYTLVSGTGSTDNASFTITGSSLKLAIVPDFETKTSYSVLVRSTDASGLSFDKQFAISITNVNEAPTIIPVPSVTYTNTNAIDTFQNNTGTVIATDVDLNTTLVYGIAGQNVSLGNGQATKVTPFGSLTLDTATGAYTFTPNQVAINGLSGNTAEIFNLTVSDGQITTRATLP